MKKLIWLLALIAYSVTSAAQSGELIFREDWKETEAALPVTQEHVSNLNLILSLHGPGKDRIKKSNHPHIPNDPFYIWSGDCAQNWAVSLMHKEYVADLTGEAFVSWRSRQSGFRQMRLILKLADGTWLVSDQYEGASDEWREMKFKIADLRWRVLDIEKIIEGNWREHPDLSKVEEIGFTDLMAGGGSNASSRLDWIEVCGKRVKRQ